ncbi:MAG: c-type cytochrome [Alphaproteobacteria bacterium]
MDPRGLRRRPVYSAASCDCKALHFTPGALKSTAGKPAALYRGAYLVEALGHCAECHTPRTLTGGLDTGKWMAGTAAGPDGELMPNISPDAETGIGEWDLVDIVFALETGIKPDGDAFDSFMAEVVEDGTSHLTQADRRAIALYLRSLAPLRNKLEDKGGSDS